MALTLKPPVIPPYNSGVALDIKEAITNFFNVTASTVDDSVNYVLAFKNWMERRKLAFDEIIERYYSGDYDGQYPVALLGTVFDIYGVLEAIDLPDETKVQDLHGNWFDVDDVCEAIGNINQMYYMNISFVEVVATAKSNISSSISEFKSRCEILYGQVNAKVLEYQSMLASILTNSHTPMEALDSFMAVNDVTIIEEPEDNNRWTSPASDITGVNPFFAVIGMIDVSWDPVNWYIQSRLLVYRTLAFIIGTLAKTLYHVVSKAVTWINDTFIDPKDIACANAESLEPTFITGYLNKKLFITTNVLRTNLWNYMVQNHPGEYLRFVLPGGTIYLRAIRDLEQGSYLDTYIKYHLYDLDSLWSLMWHLFNINPDNFDIVNGINDLSELVATKLKPAPIGDYMDDARFYQSMVLSQYLLNFSIGLLAFDWTDTSHATMGTILSLSSTNSMFDLTDLEKENPINWARIQGNTVFNTPATRGIFSYDNEALDTAISYGTISNYDFLKLITNEGNPDDFQVSQGDIFTHLCGGLFRILSINPLSDETFIPYNFVCGPTGGRYDLVPDEEHLDAVRRSLIAIAVVAAATILLWTAMKVRKALRLTALEARRKAELAVYDENLDAHDLMKLNKKAIRAEKLAGIYVPDVASMNANSVDVAEIKKLITG